MKKILLFAAAAAVAALSANADQGLTNIDKRCADGGIDKNYVVNGNFDDPAYEQSADEPSCYGWNAGELDGEQELSVLPGWNLATGGMWNGTCMIKDQDPDDWFIFAGNTQCLHMNHYHINGWTKIKVNQQITGLTPGKQYRLDFYVAHQYSNSLDWANPDQGFTLYDKPLAEGENGMEIVTVSGISEDSEFEYYIYDFTAPSDEVIIELWGQNYNGEGNQSGKHWVDWDEVRVYDESLCDYSVENPSSGDNGIFDITFDNAQVEIYTLQGVRVPNNSELNGVYIVKQGNKVVKAIY